MGECTAVAAVAISISNAVKFNPDLKLLQSHMVACSGDTLRRAMPCIP